MPTVNRCLPDIDIRSRVITTEEQIVTPSDPAGTLDTTSLEQRLRATERELARLAAETREIHRAGLALSSERDMDALQALILGLSRRMTCADAGTLYLVQSEGERRWLLFSASQTTSIDAPLTRQTMPLDRKSIAGYVASTGQPLRLDDAYVLPTDAEFAFNPAFDRRFGYRTRSLLTLPMIDLEGTIVGVLQLLNRKRHADAILHDADAVEREVVPFSDADEYAASALASQAAVALQNRMLLETNRLYRELQEYVREVHKVTAAAADVEAQSFDEESLRDVARRGDALGQLARVFQRMAREIQAREARLRQQVAELRIEIDQARRSQQVAEITESDFFLDLEAKARALRARR
jgi:GAF domain-containing protein